MRVFYAIPLSEAWKESLAQVQDRLLEKTIKGSRTKSENLHLTLQFIGDIEVEETKILKEEAKKISLGKKPFLEERGLGAFSRGKEELVYLELFTSPGLLELNRKIREMLSRQEIDYDKKTFKAHITLLRRVLWREKVDLGRSKLELAPYEVDMFYLYSSTLTPQGPKYRVLDRISLST